MPAAATSVDLAGITIVDPRTDSRLSAYGAVVAAGREKMTPAMGARLVSKPLYFGGMMVRQGDAEAMVAGAANPTRRVIEAGLMTIGLGFVIRYTIQFFAGTEPRKLDVNVTDTFEFLGLSIGRTQLIVVIVGLVVLAAVAMMLRYTSLGRQMRALADNFDLAETTGINTTMVVILTWALAGGLAGLAGVLVGASINDFRPETFFPFLLSLFAAVTLGGIGNAFGALAGGMVIGITQEWSTIVIDSEWKVAISFLVLIIVLIVRPQGIFGKERTL